MQVSKGGSGDGTFSLASKGSLRVVFILGENFAYYEVHILFPVVVFANINSLMPKLKLESLVALLLKLF